MYHITSGYSTSNKLGTTFNGDEGIIPVYAPSQPNEFSHDKKLSISAWTLLDSNLITGTDGANSELKPSHVTVCRKQKRYLLSPA